MKTVSSANLQGMREEIDSYDEIRDNISNLTFFLKDMNTLTPEMHESSNFASLIASLEKRLVAGESIPAQPVPAKPADVPGVPAASYDAYMEEVINRLGRDEYQELRGERAGSVKFDTGMERIRKGFLGTKDHFRVLFVECGALDDAGFAEIEKEVKRYAREQAKKLIDSMFVTCVVLGLEIPESVKDKIYRARRPKVGISDVSIVVMVAYSAAENDIFYPRDLPDDYDCQYEENIKRYLVP